MKKPRAMLGLFLSSGYLIFVIAVIVETRCHGGETLCGMDLGLWFAAFPWTYPFLWSEDTLFHYYAMFVLAAVGISVNLVILYVCGYAVADKWKAGGLP